MRPIPESDQALAQAFVDGDLPEPERTSFQMRLASEPDLAQHVEALLATDALVRRHVRPAAVISPRPRRRLARLFVVASAAAAAAVAVALLWREPSRHPAAVVALRPSFESAGEWIAHEPALSGMRPPGLDELRGPGQPADADPRSFVETAQRAELRALEGPVAAETTSAFYSVALRLPAASDVVVAAFPASGTAQTLFPAQSASVRLEAGEHVLPTPSFRLVEDQRGPRVEFQRGFLVPIGAGRVDVVVATRPARASGLEPALLAPAGTPAAHAARLAAEGFATRAFVVRE